MDEHEPHGEVLIEAVETATSLLETGEDVLPFVITDRWGDRRVEQFRREELTHAKAKFAEFVRSAAGSESGALVYIGRVGGGEDAIVVERGRAGAKEPEVFVQHFRPRRSRLRGFKLIGEPRPVGTTELVP